MFTTLYSAPTYTRNHDLTDRQLFMRLVHRRLIERAIETVRFNMGEHVERFDTDMEIFTIRVLNPSDYKWNDVKILGLLEEIADANERTKNYYYNATDTAIKRFVIELRRHVNKAYNEMWAYLKSDAIYDYNHRVGRELADRVESVTFGRYGNYEIVTTSGYRMNSNDLPHVMFSAMFENGDWRKITPPVGEIPHGYELFVSNENAPEFGAFMTRAEIVIRNIQRDLESGAAYVCAGGCGSVIRRDSVEPHIERYEYCHDCYYHGASENR